MQYSESYYVVYKFPTADRMVTAERGPFENEADATADMEILATNPGIKSARVERRSTLVIATFSKG